MPPRSPSRAGSWSRRERSCNAGGRPLVEAGVIVRVVAGLVVLAVGAGLAYFVFTAVNGPIGVPLTSSTPNQGQAATQFGSVDFKLEVTGVSRTGAGTVVELVFRNTSHQQQRADPRDFSLVAGHGRPVSPTFGSGCPDWGRVDLYGPAEPASDPLRDAGGTRAGPTWGPSPLCFPPPGNGPLTLIWEPDVAFGPLSEPINIPLR